MVTKLAFDEYLKSFTPFYVDPEFDAQVLGTINEEVAKYKDLLGELITKEGIELFIEKYEDSLKIILSLIDLSGEKFKRIITSLRIKNGEVVGTEWDFDRIRREILNNNFYKAEIIDMFLNGNKSDLGKELPSYYLENASIDKHTIKKLADEFYLKRLLKKVGDGKYNNDVGDKVEDLIATQLKVICDKYNLTYTREKFVPWIKRNMDFCIPNEINPFLIIESSFQVTTGSGQTTKRNDEVKTSQTIRDFNIQNDKNVAFVNFCDGSGWIARQSDLKKIYNCSHYVLNLKNLHLLEEIILEHMPKSKGKSKR